MSDEGKLRQDMARGARASALLADPLLAEAFDGLRDEYTKAWAGSQARDSEGRERLWQAVQIVGKVKTHLEKIAADGRLAQKEMAALTGEQPGVVRRVFGGG